MVRDAETPSIATLDLVGGRPALDFVNSEGGVRNGPPERIPSYRELAAWSAHAGLLDEAEADRLAAAAEGRPDEAERVHARAIELREALYRILGAARTGEAPDPADRAVLDRELAVALDRLRLVPEPGGWRWRFAAGDRLDRILWPVARDAADLLSDGPLDRVKECGGPDCTWLFVDESRNRSRRWCDMAECGNRAKARRYYRRRKGARSKGSS